MSIRKPTSVLLASLVVLGSCSSPRSETNNYPLPSSSASPSSSATPSLSSSAASSNVAGFVRPRPTNPGAINTNVTQDNIKTTICVSGYTATIRPPVSFTSSLKRRQIIEYGYGDTDMKNYEEDHIIPLELGGAPSDVKNLWPQPLAQAKIKDKDENSFHSGVCSGALTLVQAQQQILAKWGSK